MANPISRRDFLKSSLFAGAAIGLGFSDASVIKVGNHFDTIVRNGLIYTGDGRTPVNGSLGIKNGKIAAMGEIGDSADVLIDAAGKAVSPGFIDIHSHTDGNIFYAPLGDSKIYQGVTTDIGGNCGESVFPGTRWKSISDYYSDLKSCGHGFNIGSFIGQGTLRHIVVGDNNVPADNGQIKKMKYLLEQEMERGALGITSGLEYTPGSYATSDEIAELCKVVGKRGGLFAIHMRNEDDQVEEALEEAVSIASKAGVKLEISHLKAQNAANWHKAPSLISRIEKSRSSGLDIAFDRYPYIAFSTGMSIFVPLNDRQGSNAEIVARLNDDTKAKEIGKWVMARMNRLGGSQNVMITSAKNPENRKFVGLNVKECAKLHGTDEWEFIRYILVSEEMVVDIVGFAMKEENVKLFLSHPLGMPISDCSAYSPTGKLSENMPHPRAYGTFPRFIGKYCRDEKLMDISRAIEKCTSLPASRIGLKDRGLLAVGNWADITIFDPKTILDRATFDNPHQFACGIEHVIVNGVHTIRNGIATGQLNGVAL